ncbi:MAG: hypothetical protein H0W28_02645 [Pyrinomonadaceae bacterium]|nr:hypothetical protein [Pyrinomonadaceae bacterium]
MKKKENRLFGFLMTLAVVGLFVTVAVVGLFGLSTGQAQETANTFQVVSNTFSGRAVGIDAETRVAGLVTVEATVADTGPLPPGGGTLSNGVATASITSLALATNSQPGSSQRRHRAVEAQASRKPPSII